MSRLLVFVGIGGFVGSVLCYLASGYVQQLTQSATFSYGTIAVNVLGCFMIGFLSQLAESRGLLSAETRALLIPGFMGGFNTFSIERLSEDLPIVIEIVDVPQKVEDFLSFAERSIKRGMLVTVEKVQVRVYRGGSPAA